MSGYPWQGIFSRTGLLMLFAASTVVADGSVGVTDQQVETKAGELKEIRSQIGRLESELGSAERQQQLITQELRHSEQQVGVIARRLRVLDGSLGRQEKKLQALQLERQSQHQELGQQQDALVRQLRSAYAMGRQQRLKILLNQQDPAIVSRLMVYYDYLNRARARQMGRIEEILASMEQTELLLNDERKRLGELKQKALVQQQQLKSAMGEREQVVARLQQTIQGKDRVLNRLKQDEHQLQGILTRLQDEIATHTLDQVGRDPFAKSRGKLLWPTKGRLSARFGSRKVGSLKWDGVMISAPEGSDIRAVHHGRVAFADWLRGFGLLLIIDHGDGYLSLYGHNQSLFKEVGEWVEPGESVASVGRSGGRMDAGVYFGIRRNGKPVNPGKWCQRTRGNKVG
ncbi:MAG: peptidoglycan DD-metalloendopeptidase family protein [Gammaproteobacteria bacterium]|nr:peptidoglycan DD-metalloendopeptidase family protein [Gammaproteobacteria bacterium]